VQRPGVAQARVGDVDLAHRNAPCLKALSEHGPRDQRADLMAAREQAVADVGEHARRAAPRMRAIHDRHPDRADRSTQWLSFPPWVPLPRIRNSWSIASRSRTTRSQLK